MARSIVLPLYPHTSDAEIESILEQLRAIGLDGAVLVAPVDEDGSRVDAPEHEERVPVESPGDAYHGYAPALVPVDQEGRRVDTPEAADLGAPYSIEHAAALRSIREDHAEPVGLDRFEIRRPDRFRDHAEEIGYARALELLRIVSRAIPERDGWRVTADGREWYSAAWLGASS